RGIDVGVHGDRRRGTAPFTDRAVSEWSGYGRLRHDNQRGSNIAERIVRDRSAAFVRGGRASVEVAAGARARGPGGASIDVHTWRQLRASRDALKGVPYRIPLVPVENGF